MEAMVSGCLWMLVESRWWWFGQWV